MILIPRVHNRSCYSHHSVLLTSEFIRLFNSACFTSWLSLFLSFPQEYSANYTKRLWQSLVLSCLLLTLLLFLSITLEELTPNIIGTTPSTTHQAIPPKRRDGNEGRFLALLYKWLQIHHFRSWFRGKLAMAATINIKLFCQHILGSTDAKMHLWENLSGGIPQILLQWQLRQQVSWRKDKCFRNITLAECSLYSILFYFMDAYRKPW